MASKTTYKVPVPINRSFLDHRIMLGNTGGQISLASVLAFIASLMVLFFILSMSTFDKSPLWMKVAFVVVWAVMSFVACRDTKRDELALMMTPSALSFLSRKNRRVMVRSDSNPYPFMKLTGVENITDAGDIEFLDGSYGRCYQMVGSASRLLFPADEADLLHRVDMFFRKLTPGMEIIWITVKQPQRTDRQIANLHKRFQTLDYANEDFAMLCNRKYAMLSNVGKHYKSIHQYGILKADSVDRLRSLENMVRNENTTSSLVFRSCIRLDGKETTRVLATPYRGR